MTLNLTTLVAVLQRVDRPARAGTTVVAEAAFQNRLWRPGLEPLTDLAEIRVIRCTVTDAHVTQNRIARRLEESEHRAAHADLDLLQAITTGEYSLNFFVPISLRVPTLTVDTSHGYQPNIHDIAAFIARISSPSSNGPAPG